MKRRRPAHRATAPNARRKPHRRLLQLESLEARQLMASDVITGFGVIGDNYSDEYDPQAYTYASNWVELLAGRGINLGAQGTQTDYRGAGYAFNWSMKAGSVLDLNIAAGPIHLSGLIFQGQVSHAVMMYGMTDFADLQNEPNDPKIYEQIYNGTLDADSHAMGVSTLMGANIDNYGDTEGHFVVVTIPDPGDLPSYRAQYPDVANRQRVTDAIQSVNAVLKERAAENNIPVFDLFAMQKALLGNHSSPIGSQTIGGVGFSASAGGSANSATLFTADGYHPHTAMQALIANGVMTAMNQGYGANLQLFTEQEIAGLAGQTFASNTLNLNYSSFVSVPDMPIVLDFGAVGDSLNDFAARIAELWDGNGGTGVGTGGSLTPGEIEQLRASVLAQVQAAFSAGAIGNNNLRFFDYDDLPDGLRFNVSEFHRVNLGLETTTAGDRNAIIGHFGDDWRNTELNGAGFIAPEELKDVLTNLTGMDRAARIQYIRNALSFYTVQGIGLSLGLTHADALGRPQITPANYGDTGGVQNIDFMSGNEDLGFSIASLKSNVAFSFSPLAKAKLQMATRLFDNRLAAAAETAAVHDAIGTAQTLALQTVAGSTVKIGGVARANVSAASQTDLYSFQAQSGQLITVQTLLAQQATGSLNTRIRLLDATGNELRVSDDTSLGFNSLNPSTGAVLQSTNSLILNFAAPAAGIYYVEVTGTGGTTGEYDLVVATMPASTSNSPWQNPTDPLNVDNQPGIVPLDVLLIINELNNRLYSDADGRLRPPPVDKPPPYYDVDGDGYVIPLDALLIINHLNRNPGGSGEGEQSLALSDDGNSASTAKLFEEVGSTTGTPGDDSLAAAQWFWQTDSDDEDQE